MPFLFPVFSRRAVFPALCAVLTACSSGSSIDGELKGRFGSRDTDMSIAVDTSGAPLYEGTLPGEANIDIAPGAALLGGTSSSSSIGGGKCLLDPCPVAAEITFRTPPPIIYAGTWKAPEARLVFSDDSYNNVAGVSFAGGPDNRFELTFDEPDFSSSGRVTMVNTGTVSAYSKSAGELEFKGDFRLEYQCHFQSKYYRHCGNYKQEGVSNPIHRPYTENTCPADLVAPYEVAPVWKDDTLHLGDMSIDCRDSDVTEANDGQLPLLCYLHRSKVKAGGCVWSVHFVTDGVLQQFAIAGFATGECAQKTCNTYR